MRVSNTLEKKRPLLLLSGIIIAFSFTLAAFEWRTPYKMPTAPEPFEACLDCEDEDPPITLRKEKKTKTVALKAKPKPTPDAKPVVEQIDPKPTNDLVPDEADLLAMDDDDDSVPDGDYTLDKPKIIEGWKLDKQPEYATGMAQMTIDLENNMDEPRYCYELDDGAVVMVRFTVDQDGNVMDPEVVRSDSRCFEKSALEAVKKLGKFNPAIYQGRSVPVHLYQTFKFKLQ